MKASKFNEEQITLALHMAEQTSVDEVIRKRDMSCTHILVLALMVVATHFSLDKAKNI